MNLNVSDTVIDLIRHGEPMGGRRYRGHAIDDPLTELGWQQMWKSVGDMKEWQSVVTSPLKRCHLFAQEVAKKCVAPISVDARLREVGFGVWEGKSADEIKAMDSKAFERFYDDPVNCRPEGAESLIGFGSRVAAAIDDIVKSFHGEHILIVAHAGVIRATLGHILGISPASWYRTRIDNAGITRFRYSKNQGKLEFHNRAGL